MHIKIHNIPPKGRRPHTAGQPVPTRLKRTGKWRIDIPRTDCEPKISLWVLEVRNRRFQPLFALFATIRRLFAGQNSAFSTTIRPIRHYSPLYSPVRMLTFRVRSLNFNQEVLEVSSWLNFNLPGSSWLNFNLPDSIIWNSSGIVPRISQEYSREDFETMPGGIAGHTSEYSLGYS